MTKGILGDREKALEDSYFRQQDSKLLKQLRDGATLDDIAIALAEKLQVESPEILAGAREVGITPDSAAAFLLAPFVQVAWAEGSVTKRERATVLRLARERGIDEQSPAYSQLLAWLEVRPPERLFETSLQALRCGLSVLSPKEKDERVARIIDACREIAKSSGNDVARMLGLGDGASNEETSLIGEIASKLNAR